MNKRFLFFVVILMLAFMQPLLTSAEEKESHIKLNVSSDKESYEIGDEIKYEVQITNEAGYDANQINVITELPEGLDVTGKDSIVDGNKVQWLNKTIGAYETVTFRFTALISENVKQPTVPGSDKGDSSSGGKDSAGKGNEKSSPQTGDTTSITKYVLLLSIASLLLALSLFIIIKGKKRKLLPFLLLPLIFFSYTLIAEAKEIKESYEQSHKITINNKEFVFFTTVEAVYDIDETLQLTASRAFGDPYLEWNEIEDATYTVFRGDKPNSLKELEKGIDDSAYLDSDTEEDNVYFYQVAAVKDDVIVHQSNVVIVDSNLDTDQDGIPDKDEILYGTAIDNPDTDGDGLLDGEEVFVYKTDPLKADTDGDGLLDGFELSHSQLDPLKADTDENGILDGDEDFDMDGLSNLEEQKHGTDIFYKDTDNDGLTDYQEVKELGTNPLSIDTDNDNLDDESELKFGTDPLNPDTNGNGILDGDEKREQEIAAPDLNVSISFNATGDAEKTTEITDDEFVLDLLGQEGMVGSPVDITTYSEFDEATLTFNYNPDQLADIKEENLSVFYFNPDTWKLELVEDQTIDFEKQQVSANLSHFSTYVLADKERWAATFIENVFNIRNACIVPDEEKNRPIELVFVIDSSGSMTTNDPENYRLEGAKEIVRALDTDKGDRASVVDFNSSARLRVGLTNNEEALINAINMIGASGGTNIGRGVDVALTEIDRNGRDEANYLIILLTDGDGSYSNSYTNRAKEMGVKIFTIGLGDNVNVSLLEGIASGTDGDFYHTLSAEEIPALFEKARDVSQDTDTDEDCIPDWVEKHSVEHGGYIVEGTLGTKYMSDFEKKHSDDDGLTDLEELAPRSNPGSVEAAINNIITNEDKTKVHLREWPNSNPMATDTDGDSKPDNVDVVPYVKKSLPAVFIHGINSNSKDVWGLETFVSNSDYEDSKLKPITDDLGQYVINVNRGFTEGYRAGMDALVPYSEIDVQYVRGYYKWRDLIGEYFKEEKGLEYNRDFFVFNWENNHHIDVMAGNLEKYLNGLEEHFRKNAHKEQLDIFNEAGIAEFNLVGHSAGGLISRFYIENLMGESDPRIKKLITLNTPHFGSGWADTGANSTIGGFGCTNVLDDLRTKYSYLHTSDSDKIKGCSQKSGSYLSLNRKETEYHFIGGFVVEPKGLNWGTKIGTHLEKNVQFPNLTQDEIDNLLDKLIYENGVLPEGRNYSPANPIIIGGRFGDEVVNIYSQFGVPLDKQIKYGEKISDSSWNGYQPLQNVNRHVYIADTDRAEHSEIAKEKVIHDLIYDILGY